MLASISTVFRFTRAVVRHWGALVSGGAIIGFLGIWQGTGHHVPPTVFWIVAIVGIFVACYLAWNEERLAKEKAISEKHEAVLVAVDHHKTVARIRFAYEENCACVYVNNTGAIAEFFAPLRVRGYIEDVHARWAHTNDVRTKIPSGIERKLILAKLHYTFGAITTSQWEIVFNRDGVGIGSTRPTYSSVVGHPDAQAPDIRMEIIVASDPDMDGGIQSKQIILHSNRAEEDSGQLNHDRIQRRPESAREL